MRILATAVLLALVSLAASPARADGDAEKARQLFSQGSKYYDLGQFDKAIEAWQQGYDQKPDPGFLYNIAQAYRQKQDAQRAIFFYKGYLRNSPKAQNRVEVEQKIAALQKQADQAAATPATGTPPPATTTPLSGAATTTPGTTTPPPAASDPSPPNTPSVTTTPPMGTEPPPAGFSDGTTPAATATLPGPSPDAAGVARRIDLRGALGTDVWSGGVNGTADPSFALTLGAGYTFGSPERRFRFRLGGIFGYTFLAANSDQSKVTFVSILIDPTLEIRIVPRWYVYADLGLGFVALAGLKPGSTLLQPGQTLMVNGAQSMSETRVGLALELRLRPDVGIYASMTAINSPQKEHFYEPISRVGLLAGVTYRM
jgi:hypothetical protein